MATPDELEDVRKNVRKILEPMVKVFPQSKHPNHAVGTSKTFRSLARLCGAVMRAPGREDSWIMTREQLEDWIPRLAAIAPEQRVALPGITPERTMQIVGGGVVADEIMKALNIQEVEICRGRCVKARFCAGSTNSAAPASVSSPIEGNHPPPR